MADIEKGVNVKLTATDEASDKIEKVGKESKESMSAVKRFGAGAASAFSKLGATFVVANQSIELFKKFRDVGLIAIEATKEFVGANDPLLKSFEQTSNSVKRLNAGVGVILIKALNGASKALQPVINRTQKWLQSNQNLIGQKIVEYTERFAKFSLVVAAKGLILISKITSGWSMLWPTLKTVVNSALSAIMDNGAKALEKMASLAEAVGMDGLAGKFRSGAEQVKGFGEVFQETSDESMKELEKQIAGQEKFEKAVAKNAQAVYEGIGVVASEAMKAFTGETVLANKTLEQQQAIKDENELKEKEASDLRQKRAEEEKKRLQDAASKFQEQAGQFQAVGDSLSGAFLSGFSAAEEGQNKVARGFISLSGEIIDQVLLVMQKVVTARAAEAAAGAASSQSAIPVVGPALAAGAASLMFGLVRGFISMGFQSFAEGGLVKGGIPGHDSVPIMAQAGEMVLTRDQVDRMRQEGGLNGGGQVTIEMNSQIPAGRAEIKRFVRQNVVPALKDLRNQGMF